MTKPLKTILILIIIIILIIIALFIWPKLINNGDVDTEDGVFDIDTSEWVTFNEDKEGVKIGVLPNFKYPKDWYTYNFAGGQRVGIIFSDGGNTAITNNNLDHEEVSNILYYNDGQNTNECKIRITYDGAEKSYYIDKYNSKQSTELKKYCDKILLFLEEQIVN